MLKSKRVKFTHTFTAIQLQFGVDYKIYPIRNLEDLVLSYLLSFAKLSQDVSTNSSLEPFPTRLECSALPARPPGATRPTRRERGPTPDNARKVSAYTTTQPIISLSDVRMYEPGPLECLFSEKKDQPQVAIKTGI